MRTYTTAALLDMVERNGAIPVDTNAFSAADILKVADEQLQTVIVPLIMAHRERHFLTYSDVVMTSTDRYAIPIMAINRSLQNVAILSVGDGEPESLIPIDHDREMEIRRGFYTGFNWRNEFNSQLGYYFEGDELVIYPDPIVGRTLRLFYYRLPNQLVQTSEAGLITSVNTGTGVITCSGGVPSTISTSTPICAIYRKPGFKLLFDEVTPSNKTGTTVTVSLANSALVAAGDYIALEGDSPIPQIPVECHPILAQATVVKMLKGGLGDTAGGNDAREELQTMVEAYVMTHKDRSENAPNRVGYTGNRLADRVC